MEPGLLEVPDDYLRAIGLVLVRWNAVEGAVNLCLTKVLGMSLFDPRPAIVFAHMAFPQKLDCMSAMLEQLSDEQAAVRLKMYREQVQPLLKGAQKGRNAVFHSVWGVAAGGQVTRTSLTARGSLKFGTVPMRIEELEAWAMDFTKAAQSLLRLIVGSDGTGSSAPQDGQKRKG